MCYRSSSVHPSVGLSVCPSIHLSGRPSFLPSASSLPASPTTLLMLELPNLNAWYPYAYRWWQRIWNFSTTSSFEIIQIFVILPKNAISLGIYHEIGSKFLSVLGGYIYQTGFIVWLSDHLRKWKYRWRGAILKENCYLISLQASPPTLLMLESPNLYTWYPMHRDGGNVFEIFLHLLVLKKFRF